MEKIITKKIPLKAKDIGKLKDILYAELEKCIDIQIYIEESLFDEIRYNYFDYDMYPEEVETSGHYGKDMQDIYEFENPKKKRAEGMIGFISNCKGFMQVTFFKRELIDYKHYLCGMRKVLYIYEDGNDR